MSANQNQKPDLRNALVRAFFKILVFLLFLLAMVTPGWLVTLRHPEVGSWQQVATTQRAETNGIIPNVYRAEFDEYTCFVLVGSLVDDLECLPRGVK